MTTTTKTKKIVAAQTRGYIFPSEGRDMIYFLSDDCDYSRELRVCRFSDVKTITGKTLAEAVKSQCQKYSDEKKLNGKVFCVVYGRGICIHLMENGDFMLLEDNIITGYHGRDLVIAE